MDKRLHLLTALSALTLGASVGAISASASSFAGVDLQRCVRISTAADAKTEAECACEAALDDGRPETLELFFKKFAKESKDTACAALASTAIAPPSTGNGSQNPPGGGASGGG